MVLMAAMGTMEMVVPPCHGGAKEADLAKRQGSMIRAGTDLQAKQISGRDALFGSFNVPSSSQTRGVRLRFRATQPPT